MNPVVSRAGGTRSVVAAVGELPLHAAALESNPTPAAAKMIRRLMPIVPPPG